MNGLSFTRSVLLALGFAFVSSVAFIVVGPGMSFHALLLLLVPCLGFAYLLSIGQHRYRRAGWASCLVLWCGFALMLWVLFPPLSDYILLHVAALSSMRALFFHRNLLAVVMDFALSLFAVGASYWAASYTGSIFLTVWCFFLIQAMVVAIPQWAALQSSPKNTASDSQAFDAALRKGEEALRKISTK